jgi:glucose/arabinose dehydrogenase
MCASLHDKRNRKVSYSMKNGKILSGRGRKSLAVFALCFTIAASIVAACAGGSNATNERVASSDNVSATAMQPVIGELLTGERAKGDWTTDAPGVRRRLTVADLPAPYATKSVDNGPRVVARPTGAMPQVPAGFKVELFASNLNNPRMIRTAPNGDLFVADSYGNRIRILRDRDGDGKPEVMRFSPKD